MSEGDGIPTVSGVDQIQTETNRMNSSKMDIEEEKQESCKMTTEATPYGGGLLKKIRRLGSNNEKFTDSDDEISSDSVNDDSSMINSDKKTPSMMTRRSQGG